ncbi:Qa-SNARE protein [Leptomonas pyrrhocoris]|uniref:Qa-SNARE protein n=1 Tax=Leptomonas pyrrhocoris TaxID=157538 RepID=A0A0N0DZI6_LEPPY|nr:Qa-SNARE protein [Leptomonas pyrrhocoris]XP_015663772.1 Qa-SNARE protein [Leptomonas pyrrhocoris]KPA85332.1 Qa-SNARE protein [Leptomonas pyrrhocoris]KPA85333.1 Qa-SNARE protein [Leptomonas pyrrhocoris]|eukprot:XP_015663771.1 Qa-SNARE protein [Leptomonas pyrrhocoris]
MDRLQQLRTYAATCVGSQAPPPLTSYTLTPVSSSKTAAAVVHDNHLPSRNILQLFCRDADDVRRAIDSIYTAMSELERLPVERSLGHRDPHAEKFTTTAKELSRQTSDTAKAAKDKLDAMSKNTAKLKETPDSIAANSAIIRIEENQYTHLVLKLTVAMAEYQRHQAANEAFYKAQTQRQIKIKYTNPDGSAIDDATAAQLAEQVLENNTTSYIFQQSKDVLASIIETRNDIYRIEQSMRDLNQLFNDLAFLVREQDESLDVILVNFQRSSEGVEKGRLELKQARKYKRSIRNKVAATLAATGVVAGGAAAAALIP